MKTQEIECRFLEIDTQKLIQKLKSLGAVDEGENLIEETVIYDKDLKWRDERKFVRIRKVGDKIKLTYKEHDKHTIDGTYELELEISDYQKAELLFEKIGLRPFRHQQKRRHTFQLDNVTVDIDSWPMIPTFVELEGESVEDLQKAAKQLGLDWKDADTHDARWVIENVYNIPVGTFTWYTFDTCE